MAVRKQDHKPELHRKATWYVEYYHLHNGIRKRIRRSKTYDGTDLNAIADLREREKVAQAFLKEVERRITPPAALTPQNTLFRVALMDAVALKASTKENTNTSYSSNARWLLEYFERRNWQNIRCDELTFDHIQAYFDYIILERKAQNTTHNTRKANLRAVFSELVQRKYLPENYISRIRTRKTIDTKRRPMTEDEEKEIVAAIVDDRAMLFAYIMQRYCGVRPDEIRHLRCSYFRLSEGLLIFPGSDSKNGKNSPVTIPAEIIPILEGMKLHQYPGNWYVLGRNNDNTNKGLAPKPEMIGKNTLGEKFRNLFKALKKQGRLNDITGLQFYSLKDTLAVGMLDSGIDVESAMRHLRQRDLETFQRYVKRLGIVNEKIRAMPLRVPIPKK